MAKIVCKNCGNEAEILENATRPEWLWREIHLEIDQQGKINIPRVERWVDEVGACGAEEFEYYECVHCDFQCHRDVSEMVEIKPTHISERWAHGPEQGQLIKDN